MAYRRIKRLIDVAVAVPALVLVSPVMALVALAVRVSMGRPVLFKQQRIGLREQSFTIHKFRTMRQVAPGRPPPPDEERVTAVGAVLRRLSLDELPQLWNILTGDMSLVGPRPLYPSYLPYYRPWEHRRHQVRPGVTGLAQVSGRNSLDWDRRLELDVQYVEHCSMALDARIIGQTVLRVLQGRDINPASGERLRALYEVREPHPG